MARLALDLMDPRRSRSAAVASPDGYGLCPNALPHHEHLRVRGRCTENYVRLGRQLVKRAHDPNLAVDPALPRRSFGFGLAFRGHMAEALSVLGTDRLYLVSQIAALGAMPRDSAATVFNPLLHAEPVRPGDLVFALPWWAREHDTTALGRAIELGDREAGRMPTARFLGEAARAWRALASRDSAAALTRFLQLPDCPITRASATGNATRRPAAQRRPPLP